MVIKDSQVKTVDQALMDYLVNKDQWEIKVSQENRDRPAMMDQEDHLVNVVYQVCLDLMVKVSKEKQARKVKKDQLEDLVKMVEKDQRVNQLLLISEMLLGLLVREALSVHLVFLAKTENLEKLVNLDSTAFLVKKVRKDHVANLVFLVNLFLVQKVMMARKENKDILANKVNLVNKEIQENQDQEENKVKKENLDYPIQVFLVGMVNLVYQVRMVVLENLAHKVKKAKMVQKVFEVVLAQLAKPVHQVLLVSKDEKVNHLKDLLVRRVTKVKLDQLVYPEFPVIKVHKVPRVMQSKATKEIKAIEDFPVNKVDLVLVVLKDLSVKLVQLVKKDRKAILVGKVIKDQSVNLVEKVNVV